MTNYRYERERENALRKKTFQEQAEKQAILGANERKKIYDKGYYEGYQAALKDAEYTNASS